MTCKKCNKDIAGFDYVGQNLFVSSSATGVDFITQFGKVIVHQL